MLKLLAYSLTLSLAATPALAAGPKYYHQTTAPATCTVGDLWIDTDATAGNQISTCTAANTWTKNQSLVGDCTAGPCLDGSADGGNLIKLRAGTGSYWTALQGGSPAANRSWRLPIAAAPAAGETLVMTMDEYGQMGFLAAPETSGYVLSSTDAGVLSWAAGGSGAGDDLGSASYSDVVALWTTCTGYLKSDGTCDTPSGSATYPSAAGVANWGGSAWGTSYTVGTGASNLVQLNGSAQLPAVSAALLTNFPTLNQNTTGTAGGLTGTPNITVGTISAGAAGFGVDADGDATAKTMTAGSYLSSAADGSRYSTLPNNTSGNAPAAAAVVNGFYAYINELYAVENSGTPSKILLENDVDDAPVDGATASPVSSNRMYDHENAADPHTGYVLESGLGSGTLTMLGNAPGAEAGPTTTIEAGTSALGTSEIASGACASAVTTAATNAATTDVINWGFNGDPTGVTGYAPTANGMLTIIAYPSSGNVNFKVCNLTAAAITPGAITLNWRIQR